jgi:dTDP-4-dehydrorhamnose 3,5-epimerase
MDVKETKISGCYEIQPQVFQDDRGSFVKTFHQDIFDSHHLETNFTEEYYSISHRNVLRGLHFQIPPQHHVKLVYCVQGQVIDVVVDLRVNSPTYGEFQSFDLCAERANLIYVPPGLAHGFYVTSEVAIMIYKVSTVYAPECDAGILWSSVGIPWLSDHPILSKRDREFTSLADFNSPFIYGENS